MKPLIFILAIVCSINFIFTHQVLAYDSDGSTTERDQLTIADVLVGIDYQSLLFNAQNLSAMDYGTLEKMLIRLDKALVAIEDRKQKYYLSKKSVGEDKILFQKIEVIREHVTIRRDAVRGKRDAWIYRNRPNNTSARSV